MDAQQFSGLRKDFIDHAYKGSGDGQAGGTVAVFGQIAEQDELATAEGKLPHASWERILDHIDHSVKLVCNALPKLEILCIIGKESKQKGTDKLTSRQIDRAIAAARAKKSKRG